MTPVTGAQAAVLGFIVRHTRTHGWPPTTREIAAWMGVGSTTNSVADVLTRLERAGYVSVDTARARGIRVLRADVLVTFERRGGNRAQLGGAVAAQAREARTDG